MRCSNSDDGHVNDVGIISNDDEQMQLMLTLQRFTAILCLTIRTLALQNSRTNLPILP